MTMEKDPFIAGLFGHLKDKGPDPVEVDELLAAAETAVGISLDALTVTDKRLAPFKNRVRYAFFSHRMEVMAEKFTYGDAKRTDAFKNLEKLLKTIRAEWVSIHKPVLAACNDRPMVPFAVAPDYSYDRTGRPLSG